MTRLSVCLILGVLIALPLPAAAEDQPVYTIVIKDHQFEPQELKVPAGQKVKLVIDNQDPTPEEFESHDLKREKMVQGDAQAVVMVGPLKPGTYHYVGEFHENTAQGTIVAE